MSDAANTMIAELIKSNAGYSAQVDLNQWFSNSAVNLATMGRYKPTVSHRKAFDRIAGATDNKDKRAYLLTGNYGTGKSHLCLMLANYFAYSSDQPDVARFLANYAEEDLDAANALRARRSKGRFLIALCDYDSTDSFAEVVLRAVLSALGEAGIADVLDTPYEEARRKLEREFRPFQVSAVDLDYFRECRQHFTLDEWLDLMVSSIGFNPSSQARAQKMVLITRIVPLAEPRVNIVELAPKGTGKSFVYDNLSRYARVVAGGKITPAVLFHNLASHTPGLIARYDAIVLDEVQSIQGDSTGELIAGLKVYLESGRFSRGNTMGTSEAGFVMLGNITLDEQHQPIFAEEGLFREIPNFLQETAFIDRIHGLIAGWVMGRVTKDTPSHSMGFKGDFFSEILHALRGDAHYGEYVSQEMRLVHCDDLRDRKAITRLATGYLKLLFPDLQPTPDEFREYCVRPAVELRQRVRDELHKLDPEYAKVNIEFE